MPVSMAGTPPCYRVEQPYNGHAMLCLNQLFGIDLEPDFIELSPAIRSRWLDVQSRSQMAEASLINGYLV